MPFGIKEMARSGTVALKRGEQIKQQKMDIDAALA
jgi:acetolactate synthase small subunit